ncbi:MAG: PqqD family protein [Gemmatimonadales bacterium]
MSASPAARNPRFAPKPGLIETDLERELVLLDPETRQMFSLNETGRIVWRALGDDEDELARRLSTHFQAALEDARADVRRLLDELARAGLIVPRADAP